MTWSKTTSEHSHPGAERTEAERPERRWRLREGYSFTAGIFATFLIIVLLIALDVIVPTPLGEQILFAAVTLAAVIDACRKRPSLPSLVGDVLMAVFFGLASFVCFIYAAHWLGFGYAVLAFVWSGLAVYAGIEQHRARKEQLARLDRAIQALRRAAQNEPGEAPADRTIP